MTVNLYRVSYQYHERDAHTGKVLSTESMRGTLSAAAVGVEEAINKIRNHLSVPYTHRAVCATDVQTKVVGEIDLVTSVENCGRINLI